MPFRSSAGLPGAGDLAQLKMGRQSQHAGVLWMESKNLLGPWGTEQGQEAQGSQGGWQWRLLLPVSLTRSQAPSQELHPDGHLPDWEFT